MRKTLSILFALALVLSFSVVATTPVAAATIDVPDDYTTIQGAIAAASPGDTIQVAVGTYVEVGQIVINKDLTIIGADKTTTIIKPAQNTGGSGDARGWFLVQAGNQFNLSNVTLDGAGWNVHQAIRSFGSGTIDNNIIKNIRYSQYIGLGMVVMGDYSMTFSNNSFTDIERIGMMAFGGGVTNAQMIGNTYTGKGPGDYLDYGIEIGGGATATIIGNTITDCGVSSTAWASAGIMVNSLYADPGEVSGATITCNTLTNNEVGIYVGYGDDAPDVVVASFNNISGNTNWGIRSRTAIAMDAKDNWWGDGSGPYHTTLNTGGLGDDVSDNVDFTPWLGTLPAPTKGASTATGTGAASFATSGGKIADLVPVTPPGLPSVAFPHGMFSFQICCLDPGESVVVTVTLPSAVPVGTVWWKYDNGRWSSLPNLSDDGDNTMKIRLTDGGSGDSDSIPGQITDPGGPGNPMTVGWEGSPVSKSTVLWPLIALLTAIVGGLALLVLRYRRAER